MNQELIVIGAVVAIGSVIYCLYRAAWYFRRGAKDHLWIWMDAHRAARFLGFIGALHFFTEIIRKGFHESIWLLPAIWLVLLAVPYLFYALGRIWVSWRRARETRAEAGSSA